MPAPKDAPKTPPPQQDWTHTLARGVVSLAGFAVAGVLTLLAWVWVTEGLKVGDRIVVEGLVNLRDGVSVHDLAEVKG